MPPIPPHPASAVRFPSLAARRKDDATKGRATPPRLQGVATAPAVGLAFSAMIMLVAWLIR
jgi:hypothetical protein